MLKPRLVTAQPSPTEVLEAVRQQLIQRLAISKGIWSMGEVLREFDIAAGEVLGRQNE